MKVKFYLFTHPQWHLVHGYNKVIAPTYILSQIELETKGYQIKHSIANIMNQLNCTLDVTNVLKYNSQRGALLLMVSKNKLEALLAHLTH
jgi:hypothetical protein